MDVWLQSRLLPARGCVGLEVHRCLCIIDAGFEIGRRMSRCPGMQNATRVPPSLCDVTQLLIQQIHPHVRVERDSGMCVARDLYELWGRSPYTRMFVVRTTK